MKICVHLCLKTRLLANIKALHPLISLSIALLLPVELAMTFSIKCTTKGAFKQLA